jgi:hypothetical protein
MTAFSPEYAGKMNFYLSAVDDMLRHPDDKPGIGLILCKGKDGLVAEYALRDINKPLGSQTFVIWKNCQSSSKERCRRSGRSKPSWGPPRSLPKTRHRKPESGALPLRI